MAIKHWVRENGKGYFIGPEEEMYHPTDTECEPQPSINHDWVDGVWVLNEERKALHDKYEVEQELRRTDRFMFIDSELSDQEMEMAKAYRQSLRMLQRKEISDKPLCPECINEKDSQ